MYSKVIDWLLNNDHIIKATYYGSENLIIRAVRKTYKAYSRKPRKTRNLEISLTIGKPNYAEREFIKLCKKSGEKLPLKKIQLKFYNPKPNKLKRKKANLK